MKGSKKGKKPNNKIEATHINYNPFESRLVKDELEMESREIIEKLKKNKLSDFEKYRLLILLFDLKCNPSSDLEYELERRKDDLGWYNSDYIRELERALFGTEKRLECTFCEASEVIDRKKSFWQREKVQWRRILKNYILPLCKYHDVELVSIPRPLRSLVDHVVQLFIMKANNKKNLDTEIEVFKEKLACLQDNDNAFGYDIPFLFEEIERTPELSPSIWKLVFDLYQLLKSRVKPRLENRHRKELEELSQVKHDIKGKIRKIRDLYIEIYGKFTEDDIYGEYIDKEFAEFHFGKNPFKNIFEFHSEYGFKDKMVAHLKRTFKLKDCDISEGFFNIDIVGSDDYLGKIAFEAKLKPDTTSLYIVTGQALFNFFEKPAIRESYIIVPEPSRRSGFIEQFIDMIRKLPIGLCFFDPEKDKLKIIKKSRERKGIHEGSQETIGKFLPKKRAEIKNE